MIKLAIIGTKDSVKLINDIIDKNFSTVESYNLILDKVKNLKNLIEKIPSNIDGIFVSGIGVYFELLKYDLSVPISYAKHDTISLIKCLEKMKNDKSLVNFPRISFDIISDTTIEDIIQEFDFCIGNFYVEEAKSGKNEDYYITKHLKLLYENKIDYVITSFGYIYSLFKSLDLPVYRMFPSILDLKRNIESLILEVKMSKLDRTKLLVYKFKLPEHLNLYKYRESFIKFAKSIDAFIDFSKDNTITLISTKTHYNINFVMNSVNEFIKDYNLLDAIVGIGSDLSVQKALNNSDIALDKVKDSRIIYFDGIIFESFSEDDKLSPINGLSTDKIIEISNNTGIIPKRIHQIYNSIMKLNNNTFSSADISKILNLSVRSANRFINSLVESGYAEFIEKDTKNNIGRPKRYVEINFF